MFVKTVDGTIVYGYVSDCTDLKNMEEKTKTVQDVCRFTVNHDYEWILLVDIPADRYEYFFSGAEQHDRKRDAGRFQRAGAAPERNGRPS